MTKKAFKEQLRYSRYGNRSAKLHGIYFDWGSGKDFVGFKYGVIVNRCTKKEAIDAAYDLFFQSVGFQYLAVPVIDWFIAETDQKRNKIPLSISFCRSNFRHSNNY